MKQAQETVAKTAAVSFFLKNNYLAFWLLICYDNK